MQLTHEYPGAHIQTCCEFSERLIPGLRVSKESDPFVQVWSLTVRQIYLRVVHSDSDERVPMRAYFWPRPQC
jgi:hypothetical protein